MSVVAVSVMSSHFHVLLFAEDAEQLALFMGHVDGNLSKEIGRAHQWPGKLWERRYRGILVSDEEEVQIARLRYLLAAGVKEHLVNRAIEWPGVHSARALTRDHPLRGWWFSRSREYAARQRGENPGRYEYASEETLVLDPLPCWRHLTVREQHRRAKDLIREIEREARAERQVEGLQPVGAEGVMTTILTTALGNSTAHQPTGACAAQRGTAGDVGELRLGGGEISRGVGEAASR